MKKMFLSAVLVMGLGSAYAQCDKPQPDSTKTCPEQGCPAQQGCPKECPEQNCTSNLVAMVEFSDSIQNRMMNMQGQQQGQQGQQGQQNQMGQGGQQGQQGGMQQRNDSVQSRQMNQQGGQQGQQGGMQQRNDSVQSRQMMNQQGGQNGQPKSVSALMKELTA